MRWLSRPEGSEGAGDCLHHLIVSFFVGIGAPRAVYLTVRIRNDSSPVVTIFFVSRAINGVVYRRTSGRADERMGGCVRRG